MTSIRWTERAAMHLAEIYEHLKRERNPEFARKQITDILETIDRLAVFLQLGRMLQSVRI
jgi:plasmid stabilization system protein ParE